MRVAVVAEYYPRAQDPVLGIWAHRQAEAAEDAGADVDVFVLHRVVPAKADAKLSGFVARLRQPRYDEIDGIPITYVKYASPPRERSYGSWGAYASRALGRAMAGRTFDLIHAHYAVPSADAVRRAGRPEPVVLSNHGGDTFFTVERWPDVVRREYANARLVLANSHGIAESSRGLGAREVRVVRLGTDVPPEVQRGDGRTVVTVGHLVARKRHDEVIRALPPGARYEIVGDGPERARLEALARQTGNEVVFHGQLPHDEALRVARRCDVFAMPSTDEAFGVAYVEAMAGGLPAIGRRGEPGPEEITGLGGGMLLTDGRDLRERLDEALRSRDALGDAARETVVRHFTWEGTGRATVAAYEDALR